MVELGVMEQRYRQASLRAIAARSPARQGASATAGVTGSTGSRPRSRAPLCGGRVFARAALGRAALPGLLGLPHVQGQGIDQMDLVTALGQGDRVGTWPAPTSSTRAGGAGSRRPSSSSDRTNSSAGRPPGNSRDRS
jgi:hypothetical protein